MLGKSRGSAIGSNTIVQNGDTLGSIYFCGADGSDLDTPGGGIYCEVDGTPGTNDMPGRLVFSTTADGASSPTERFRISSTGAQSSVIPGGSTLYPSFNCRAWVNFNGTGTVAIRASGNVSSITDNGTGDYTVNFTTAMPDANYCSTLSINTGSVTGNQFTIGELSASISTAPTVRSTTQLRLNISTTAPTIANYDATSVSVAIFR